MTKRDLFKEIKEGLEQFRDEPETLKRYTVIPPKNDEVHGDKNPEESTDSKKQASD